MKGLRLRGQQSWGRASQLLSGTCRRQQRHSRPSRYAATLALAAQTSDGALAARRNVLIFDVMDTIVKDPFFEKTPQFLQMTLKELFGVKHPLTWLRFEKGEIEEAQLYKEFFKDGRAFDGPGMKQAMVSNYSYKEGMQQLLSQLQQAGTAMYVMSNYPVWWRMIDEQLGLSAYLPWTFISCEGPMKGLRKPEPDSFSIVTKHVQETLGSNDVQLVLIDDRPPNVEGAIQAGWDAILFKDAQQLAEELQQRGLL